MAAISTNDPKLSASNVAAVQYGTRAQVSATLLAFASLANGQTFVTVTTLGAPLSYTIDAALSGKSTLAEVTAAQAVIMNADSTNAYTWTATATGLTAVAKSPGTLFNVAPSGSCLSGRVGTVTVFGGDALTSGSLVAGGTDEQYQAGRVSTVCGIHPRKMIGWYTPLTFLTLPTGMTAQNPTYSINGVAVTVSTSVIGWASNALRYFPGANFGDVKWAIGCKVSLVNDTTEAAVYLHASAQDYMGVMVSRTAGVRIVYGTGYNPAVAWGPSYTQVVAASPSTGTGIHSLVIYSRGDGTFYVEFDDVVYGSFAITQVSTWNSSGSALGMVRDSGGACSIVWNALWFMGDYRSWR